MELKIVFVIQLIAYATIVTSESLDAYEREKFEVFDETEDSEVGTDELIVYPNLEIPQLDPSNCQFRVIKKCNHKFKSMFRGKHGLTAENDRELYCKGIQAFIDCLESTTCRGTFIDNYSYVILQHGMMDKKARICPGHSYGKLLKKVKAIILNHLFVDDIGVDTSSYCSAKVHKKCVKIFTTNMKTNNNMCQDVQSFINCYTKESPKCPSNLTQHFAHLSNQLGEQMLKANEKHIGMMC